VIAKLLMVAGETEDIADTESYRAKHITLNSQSIPVSNDYLHYGVGALLLEKQTASETGQTHNSRLVIGYIDGIAAVTEQLTFPLYHFSAGALGGTGFSSDGKISAL
jgi:hypothetical protein